MKLLYYGVFDGQPWRSEYAMLEGLRQFNHNITCCNYFDREAILPAWEESKPDLVFIQYGPGFPPEFLERFSVPIVFMASEFGIGDAAHLLQAPRKPDLVLAHSQQVCEYAIAQGIRTERVHHAYNPNFYRRMEVPYTYDISLIGNLSDRRNAILFDLEICGYEVYADTILAAEDVAHVYNSSKITLHLHASEESYIPTRFFEVLPTKACLLIEDLGNNFDPRLGAGYYETFSDLEELCVKIEWLLSDQDARMEKVKRANEIAPRHTWAERMKEYSNYFESILEDSLSQRNEKK
jgi:hypothetical protein